MRIIHNTGEITFLCLMNLWLNLFFIITLSNLEAENQVVAVFSKTEKYRKIPDSHSWTLSFIHYSKKQCV